MERVSSYYLFLLIITIFACDSNTLKENSEKRLWSLNLCDTYISQNHSLYNINDDINKEWRYDIAMLGESMDKLGDIDKKYSLYYENYIDQFVNEDGSIKNLNDSTYSLDEFAPTKGLITLYKRKGEEKYLNAINTIISQLLKHPKNQNGLYYYDIRCQENIDLKGLYMICPFLAQYAFEFNKSELLNIATSQIINLYKIVENDNSEILFSDWSLKLSKDNIKINTETIGWYLMTLVDVMEYISKKNQNYTELNYIYNEIVNSLLKYQDKRNGLWKMFFESDDGNYYCASSNVMIIYAMAKGIKKGYLPEKYINITNFSFNSYVKTFIFEDGEKTTLNDKLQQKEKIFLDKLNDYPLILASFILAEIELDR